MTMTSEERLVDLVDRLVAEARRRVAPEQAKSVEHFVRRWYDLVEDDPTTRLRKRVDLLHAFDVEPRAKELARNPLLATLMERVLGE